MLFWIEVGVAAFWLTMAVCAARRIPRVRDLPPPGSFDKRSVAAVVPARDEFEEIGATVQKLCKQRGVDLDVIVVDDRSTDGTAELLDEIESQEQRVTAIHVDRLPDGWLGKPHACHVGAQAAEDATWMLFLDADSWLTCDAIARAVDAANADDAAHLCLMPELRDTTAPGRSLLLTLMIAFFLEGGRVNADSRTGYIGVGAFTLIRKDVYDEVGGHAALRAEVVEDFHMGRLVRQAGHRSRVWFGTDAVSSRWVTSLASFFQLTEKNYFAAMRYSLLRLSAAVVGGSAAWSLAAAGPWLDPLAGSAALGSLCTLAVVAMCIAGRHGWSRWNALFVPLAVPLVFAGMLWSAWRTLRYGVRWRGTTYDVASTRSGDPSAVRPS